MEIRILGGLENEKESIEMHKIFLAGCLRHGKEWQLLRGGGGGSYHEKKNEVQKTSVEEKFHNKDN
jgi:hypothetical protein